MTIEGILRKIRADKNLTDRFKTRCEEMADGALMFDFGAEVADYHLFASEERERMLAGEFYFPAPKTAFTFAAKKEGFAIFAQHFGSEVVDIAAVHIQPNGALHGVESNHMVFDGEIDLVYSGDDEIFIERPATAMGRNIGIAAFQCAMGLAGAIRAGKMALHGLVTAKVASKPIHQPKRSHSRKPHSRRLANGSRTLVRGCHVGRVYH
jgi:hypothetical protein